MSDTAATYRLRLYISGDGPAGQRAVANARRIAERWLGDDAELEVIDVREAPERAESDRVLATPTLLRAQPEPARRVIGDLADEEKVVAGLEITG